MGTGRLTIDLGALVANWKSLAAMGTAETGAVVKANGYGLASDRVAAALAAAGARKFFVATAEEGTAVRQATGPDTAIHVFSGHMDGDTDLIRDLNLIPMLNSGEQVTRHLSALPDHTFGVQLDSGMNRLGMEADEWASLSGDLLSRGAVLVMSHLACADESDHPMNAQQLAQFRKMTDGITAPRSLSATGGILLGPDYHFDVTRPGIGLYGGLPFEAAKPVVTLDLPVIQVRDLAVGETVGYGNSWTADRPSKIATVSGGYADGLIRSMSNNVTLWAGDAPCPLVGRVSMDLLTIDVTDLTDIPSHLSLITASQGVDAVADAAGTIGYEILTSLGGRYQRTYLG